MFKELIRKMVGYYNLKRINDKQDDVIHRQRLLAKKIKAEAQDCLGTNDYNQTTLYKVTLRKIIADIDSEYPEVQDIIDNEKDIDSPLFKSMSL